jgi:hypothetical protein
MIDSFKCSFSGNWFSCYTKHVSVIIVKTTVSKQGIWLVCFSWLKKGDGMRHSLTSNFSSAAMVIKT